MKTIILNLLLAITLLSSCNTAKQYANYRVGGKTKHETKTVQSENKIQVVNEMTESEITMDSLMPKNIFMDTSCLTNLAKVEDKKNPEESTKKNESDLRESKPNKISNHQILPKKLSEKNPIQKLNHKKSIQKKYKSNDGDGIYIIGVILIITGGIMALLAANVSLLEIITFGLGMVAVAILLYLIGEAFMNIFPGMSKKKKNTIKNFLNKISFVKRKNKSGMKYYGGMTVKEYFWIGMGVIALAFIGMAIFGATDLAWSIIMGLLGIHLAVCAMAALVVGFLSLFPGMNLKKSKSK